MSDLYSIEFCLDLANAPVAAVDNRVNGGNGNILLETGTYHVNGPNISRANNNNIQDPRWQLEMLEDMSVLATSLADEADVHLKRGDNRFELAGNPQVLYEGDQILHTTDGQLFILEFQRTFNFDPLNKAFDQLDGNPDDPVPANNDEFLRLEDLDEVNFVAYPVEDDVPAMDHLEH